MKIPRVCDPHCLIPPPNHAAGFGSSPSPSSGCGGGVNIGAAVGGAVAAVAVLLLVAGVTMYLLRRRKAAAAVRGVVALQDAEKGVPPRPAYKIRSGSISSIPTPEC